MGYMRAMAMLEVADYQTVMHDHLTCGIVPAAPATLRERVQAACTEAVDNVVAEDPHATVMMPMLDGPDREVESIALVCNLSLGVFVDHLMAQAEAAMATDEAADLEDDDGADA